MGVIGYFTLINLEYNRLESLPESFGNLNKLKDLNLMYNRLSSLPKSFGNLFNLRALNISNNRLSSIPPPIKSLPNLRALDINSNKSINHRDLNKLKFKKYQWRFSLMN